MKNHTIDDLRSPRVLKHTNTSPLILQDHHQAKDLVGTNTNLSTMLRRKTGDLLVRDQLINQLAKAKALIKRDEVMKVKLITKMREMHAEMIELKDKLALNSRN